MQPWWQRAIVRTRGGYRDHPAFALKAIQGQVPDLLVVVRLTGETCQATTPKPNQG